MRKFVLIEVWVTPGTKNKPETRTSKHTYYNNRGAAFSGLLDACGDMYRLLENTDDGRQIWHQ